MTDKNDSSNRKRMVVEEVESTESPKSEELVSSSQVLDKPEMVVEDKKPEPEILEEAAKTEEPAITTTEPIIDSNPEPVSKKNTEEPVKVEKQKSPIFWILIPGIFILGAILGGIFFYQKGVNTVQEETPSPTPVVSESSPTPSASPSATLDLTKYSISILNGSGTAGEAGKVKTLVTDAGFKVSSTGNAATYDYTETIIKAKSTVDKAFLSKLSETLSKEYVVGDSESLSSSSTTEVQIVVGTSKTE